MKFLFSIMISLFLSLPGARAAETNLADGIMLNGGASFGLGNMSNGNGTIMSRTVDTFSLFAMPAYRWHQIFAGPVLEWRFVGQTTDPADVNNSNLKGHGYMAGVAVGYQWSTFYALAGFDFFGKHIQDKATLSGVESRYNKPVGLRLGFGYFVHEHFTVDALVTIDSYKQNLFGDTDIDISAAKLTHRNYALGVTAHY